MGGSCQNYASLFTFKVDSFSEGARCQESKTGNHQICLSGTKWQEIRSLKEIFDWKKSIKLFAELLITIWKTGHDVFEPVHL